jgi:hypothetical protein
MTRSNWFNPRQVAKLPPLDPTTAPPSSGWTARLLKLILHQLEKR